MKERENLVAILEADLLEIHCLRIKAEEIYNRIIKNEKKLEAMDNDSRS